MSLLELSDLTLAYNNNSNVVTGLNLSISQGELVSLLGPSGCGKTTIMRSVAGLIEPTHGQIRLAGEDITRVPTHKRHVGMVFQSYALFPHLSVRDNVGFGLRMRKIPAPEVRVRVDEALESVGLFSMAARLPSELSGGQQQRVALARAIVLRPKVLLLDEPLSNLDARLRIEMRSELRRVQRQTEITMLYVTHDQDEALSLSDRIVVMNAGKIEQLGTPAMLWNHPQSPFVAQFMGFENLFLASAPLGIDVPPGATHIGFRTSAISVQEPNGVAPLATVLARSYRGDFVEYLLDSPLGHVKALSVTSQASWTEGDQVSISFDAGKAAMIPPFDRQT